MQEFEEDALPTSSFQTYSAEADHLAKNGEYKQAVMAYTNALTLRPNDKACLVFRSRCYLLMGDASSALNDANASLAGDKTYFKGIFSKAESLYATGDFEMALVYYHRGNKLRPEFNDFRLGIQKASEAIDNSIGSTFNCVDACLDPRDYKIRSQANGRSISGKTSGLPMRKAAEIVTVPKAVKAEKEKEFEVKVKQLLGELYVDRKYLEQFLVDKDFINNPNDEVMDVVKHSLNYLDSRTEFWQQQKPIYARRKEHHDIQAKTQNAKVRRVAQQKTMEKIAHENGLNNPTQKQIQNVDFEQKSIKAAIKSIYKSLERKDYSATLASAQTLLIRLGEVDNQAQRFQAMAECYSLLGITHLEIGGFAQSVLYHKKDLSISMQNDFANGRKRACVNLARAYVVLKRFREAAKMFQERLADVEKSEEAPIEFHAERAWLLHDIARCLVESGQLDEALGFAEESSNDAELSKEKQWILNSKVLIAQLQVRLDRSNDAHETFYKAYQVAKEMSDKQNQNLLLQEMEKIEASDEFTGERVCEGIKKESVVVVRAASATRKLMIKKQYSRPDSGAQDLKTARKAAKVIRAVKA